MQAYAHQDIPFEMLVEAINPVRSRAHSPLFQVMLVLQNTPSAAASLADIEIEQLAPSEDAARVSRFDLTLSLESTEAGIVGAMEYDRDLFDASTIERFLGHYQQLLAAVVEAPECRISRLGCLSDSDTAFFEQQGGPSAPYPLSQSLLSSFEHWAAESEDALALVSEAGGEQ
ncbi:condensation domain-containing protein, partial [Microbulbifer sp. TYP-18]|uniref:condensation domain-containing protein n=1 Tax=Microbulbifer sp. TYP-18 TaxID=3230024 RepID=UPI0034C64A9A